MVVPFAGAGVGVASLFILKRTDSTWALMAILALPTVVLLPLVRFRARAWPATAFYVAIVAGVMFPILWAVRSLGADGLTRLLLFEVESGVSPLVPLFLCASLPLVLTLVALRLRFLQGAHRLSWESRTVNAMATVLGGSLKRRWSALACIHEQLFAPKGLWSLVPAGGVGVAVVVLAWPGAFPSSPFGRPFGFGVTCGFLAAQAILGVGLLQFARHSLVCADLLRRLARHRIAGALRRVPKSLAPASPLPRRPHLYELQALIDCFRSCGAWNGAGDTTFERELAERPSRRWWTTQSWSLLLKAARQVAPQVVTVPERDGDLPEHRKRRLALAMVSVLVVREVLAQLTLCLLLIGPALFVQIGLSATAHVQGSHRMTALVWFNVAISVAVVMGVFLSMDRDEALSLITSTKPGQFDWNFDLLSKVTLYAVLPLMTLFISQFPGVGSSIVEFLRSFGAAQ
jgi:hypothetical protein